MYSFTVNAYKFTIVAIVSVEMVKNSAVFQGLTLA